MNTLELEILKQDKCIRIIKRKMRVTKVGMLTSFYVCYRDIYLKEQLLKSKNNYVKAEHMSDFINKLGISETKPVDFIYDKDLIINQLIDLNIEFKKNIAFCVDNRIFTKRFILSFCKNVEFSNHLLRFNNQFQYQIASLSAYVTGQISKEVLEEDMKEISLFTKKKRYNNRFFKKTFLEIEKTAFQIEQVLKRRLN